MKNILLFFLISFLIEGVFGESVTVTDGDSVTLHTGLTEIKEDDVLEWSFGAQRHRIARVRKDSEPTTYDGPDGRFVGRLKADGQTGDLTITNITSEHAGPYEISNKIKAIVTFRLIVVPADPVKTDPVSVMEGDSVTLKTAVNEILKYDVIQWRFGYQNSPIAEINRTVGLLSISNGTDGRFRDRLQMDYLTGSLTIRNIRTKHSGLYEVDISNSKHTIHKSFSVTVRGEMKSVKSVMEKNPVTLDTGLTEIQTGDSIHWMFGDICIAEFYKAGNRLSPTDDERFRNRLKLDQKTGSLTIMNTRFTDSGHYDLKIISSRRTIQQRFPVTVTGSGSGLSAGAVVGMCVAFLLFVVIALFAAAVIYHRYWISKLKRKMKEILSVIKGESVTLNPDGIEIRKDDIIQWKYEGALLAERKANGEITVDDYVLDKRFEDQLHLNKVSGSLTIKKTRLRMSGRYELWIIRRGHHLLNTFRIAVFAPKDQMETASRREGDTVTLRTDVSEIQKDDQIQWVFVFRLEDYTIAQIKEGNMKFFPSAAGWRFICRLNLDHQTGSLTIKKITSIHTGFYIVYIIRGGQTTMKLFRVQIKNPDDNTNSPNERIPLKDVEDSDSFISSE